MTNLSITRPVPGFGLIRMVRNIGRIFGSIAAAQRAADDFQWMNARTDAQLAAAGIRRADVARVVFKRYFD
jgi:isopentenyl diphosphate isomerase/L-lactate dehydrogenase-like FMN-dependent dehydrogenase